MLSYMDGVSDTGTDPSVRLVKALTLGRGHRPNWDTDMRTHNFTYGSCNFKVIFKHSSLHGQIVDSIYNKRRLNIKDLLK